MTAAEVRLERPSRVLAGEWRHRAAVARMLFAWLPFASLAGWWLLGVVFGVHVKPWTVASLVCALSLLEVRRPGYWRGRLASAWWRSTWWFDARACGLVVVADPGVNMTHERGGKMATGRELAPRLVAVRCRRHARTYVVRPLPGQTLETFDKARSALSYRWSADVRVESHPRRRRTILLEVTQREALAEPLTHPGR